MLDPGCLLEVTLHLPTLFPKSPCTAICTLSVRLSTSDHVILLRYHKDPRRAASISARRKHRRSSQSIHEGPRLVGTTYQVARTQQRRGSRARWTVQTVCARCTSVHTSLNLDASAGEVSVCRSGLIRGYPHHAFGRERSCTDGCLFACLSCLTHVLASFTRHVFDLGWFLLDWGRSPDRTGHFFPILVHISPRAA